MSYKVLDNLIPEATQQRIKSILSAKNFHWYLMRSASYAAEANVPSFWTNVETIGLAKTVFLEDNIYDEIMLPWCLQILDNALERENKELEKLFRIQVNLLYQNPDKKYKEGEWTTAHLDQKFDHSVLLYYVNDSDGDTFLFNEKRGEDFNSFTELARVTPKAGSALLFDGSHFHSASNPINNVKRMAINFNFIAKDRNDRTNIAK